MRFNQKQLSVIACRPSELTKEGVLAIKEREGRFHKVENYYERLFRLKGNLLFYFKGTDENSEVNGLIVLERCRVTPDESSKRLGFVIEFLNGDDTKYELAASCQADFEDWLFKLQTASYETLRQRMVVLRREIMDITKQDPLPAYHPVAIQNPRDLERASIYISKSDMEGMDSLPLMELSLECFDLASSTEKDKPSAFVKLSTMTPPETKWTKQSQTEVVEEESSCPYFLKTIVLQSSLSSNTRLKFSVYDMRNKTKNDAVLIGQVMCAIQDIEQAPNMKLCLKLTGFDSFVSCGGITIQGWKRISSLEAVPLRERSSSRATIWNSFVCNTLTKTFHSLTKDDKVLNFQEMMSESTLCFDIARQLLQLFKLEETESVSELHNLGSLHPEWEIVKQHVQNGHFELGQHYSNSLTELSKYKRRCFKKSAEKCEKDLEFIPTNLHIQMLRVYGQNSEEYFYDVVTVGAPCAHTLKFKHGGLRKLLGSSEESSRRLTVNPSDTDAVRLAIKARTMKNVLKRTKGDILSFCTKAKSSMNDLDILSTTMTSLSEKIATLLDIQQSSFIKEATAILNAARIKPPAFKHRASSPSQAATKAEELQPLDWEWSGKEFRPASSSGNKAPDINVTLGNAMSTFHTLMSSQTTEASDHPRRRFQSEMADLSTCCESLVKQLSTLVRFILLQEETTKGNTKDVLYRRDIVFAQTLPAILTGFMIKIGKSIDDSIFLEQLHKVGLLVDYESLLSPYGDEMGMIEDMIVGVNDLKKVKLKIICNSSGAEVPRVNGSRSEIIVDVPLTLEDFMKIPGELQSGHLISVHPHMFTIGINEQTTVAEKFGDTSIQEITNAKNLSSLQEYFDRFRRYFPDWTGSTSPDAVPLETLLSGIHSAIQAKKSKNTEILTTSSEFCWRLNGIRLTSCKSAKDRSSMSVTLEEVRILQREHDLKKDMMRRLLNTIRSQGTRPSCSFKNIGFAKYAFNKVQVRALPSGYRPPESTFGKYVQT